MKFKLLFVLILFTPFYSLSASKCTSWGCISTIKTLYINSSGVIFVGTPLDERLANCTPESGIYFTMKPSIGSKEVYSALLTAYIAQKPVMLRVIEGSSQCELSYVSLDTDYE